MGTVNLLKITLRDNLGGEFSIWGGGISRLFCPITGEVWKCIEAKSQFSVDNESTLGSVRVVAFCALHNLDSCHDHYECAYMPKFDADQDVEVNDEKNFKKKNRRLQMYDDGDENYATGSTRQDDGVLGLKKEYSGWDVYNNEAKKVDTELVKDWTASLNFLLLFVSALIGYLFMI